MRLNKADTWLLGKVQAKGLTLLPGIPKSEIKAEDDHSRVHWTKETAKALLEKWCKHLN